MTYKKPSLTLTENLSNGWGLRRLYGNLEVQDCFYRAIHGEDSLKGMNADEGMRVVEMMHELIQRAVMH